MSVSGNYGFFFSLGCYTWMGQIIYQTILNSTGIEQFNVLWYTKQVHEKCYITIKNL